MGRGMGRGFYFHFNFHFNFRNFSILYFGNGQL